MVILDEEAATERSPLKSQHAQLPPQTQGAAPPPPYAAATSAPPPPAGHAHGYQAAHDHHHHDHHHHDHQSPALLIRRDTPGQRFLKAFVCALFVLFLWSVFIDTISLLAHPHRNGNYSKKYPSRDRLREAVKTPVPCPCATPDPIRALPIQYPPISLPRVGSVPTNTAPCATATS